MSKFFEAASKLNPILVDSILSDTAAPHPISAGTGLRHAKPESRPAPPPPANSADTIGDKAGEVFHDGEFSIDGPIAAPVLPFRGDSEDAAEGYKILRTRILQHQKNPKVVCVTSAITGDGKSVTAVNIAGVLALKEHTRVLLLDCDFRHPTIHWLIGAPAENAGVAEVLAGKIGWHQAMLRCKEFPNLYVALAGQSHGRAAELLDSNAWRSGCAHLRTMFDYIVIDSPPIGLVADYDLIQDVCDGVVIVARPNHTDRSSLNKAFQAIAPEKNLGVVLNCIERWFLWRAPHDYRYAYRERNNDRVVKQRGA